MKLMVIDGNSIVNRSFYGVRPLTTRDGTPTNAVYGFVTTLLRLTEEEVPDALCVTFDRREPTFRHLAYDGYKAQRKGMPEELAVQMPILKEVLDAMDIPRYELAGYEADDLIGTISRKCEAAGWECVAVTGDKDSLQLVTDRTRVKLVSTRMGQTTTKDMTPEAFRAEYGFDPIHIIDLKALMGDTSDNIPGIKGVGEKTAMALVQRYETVDALYQALPDIEAKPGVIKKLTEGEESARMSYDLATIVTSAPLDFDPAANLCRPWKPELRQVFLRLEFNKLLGKLDLATPASAPAETSQPSGAAPEAKRFAMTTAPEARVSVPDRLKVPSTTTRPVAATSSVPAEVKSPRRRRVSPLVTTVAPSFRRASAVSVPSTRSVFPGETSTSTPDWSVRVFPAATVSPVSTSRVFFFGVVSEASVLGWRMTALPASSRAWTSASVSFMPRVCASGAESPEPPPESLPESLPEPPPESLPESRSEPSLGWAGLSRGLLGETSPGCFASSFRISSSFSWSADSSPSSRRSASPRTSGVALSPPGRRPLGSPPATDARSRGMSRPVFSSIISQSGRDCTSSFSTNPGIFSTA